VPDGFPLTKTNTLDIGDVEGWAIPFFANEDESTIYDVRIGNFWVWQLPRPKYPIDWENMPKDRTLSREGTVVHFSVSASAAGSTTIGTPASGKAFRILAWNFYCDSDVVCELRFANSGNVIAGLPAKGATAMNLVGCTAPTGDTDEPIEIYVSDAANVKGWICVEVI